MSGSRTDIFTLITVPANTNISAMDVVPSNAETPNKDDKNTPRSRTNIPVNFKLSLIAEVKKHDIVWQDRKQKKNIDLWNDAWLKIRKALHIKKTGFCEKQWKLLCHGYRSHINRNTPMHIDLIREMAFMAPQLKKSCPDNEPSDNEMGDPGSPVKNKAPQQNHIQTSKPKKVAQQNSCSGSDTECSEDERASIAILKLLFSNVPPEAMRAVKQGLVETLNKIVPEVQAKILNHAKEQLAKCGDFSKIDWTMLDVPVEVSKAVWEHRVMKMVLTD
ncbi:uncharacterized protein LOC134750624 [Cydia strobilella]|uniref:uncharacterized protein LOC134750624 n=1 Tax=Cydia strobilella TaxID=1100964 RepID=UPI003004FE16